MAKFCVKCGSMLNEENGSCPNCTKGSAEHNFNYQLPIFDDESPKHKSKKNKGKIAVISVIAALILSAATLVALSYFEIVDIPFLSEFFASDESKEKDKDKENEKNPDAIPASVENGEEYTDVINQYLAAVKENMYVNDDAANFGEYVSTDMVMFAKKCKDDFKFRVFYSINDLNSDGVPEIIIAGGEQAYPSYIFDVFTHDGSKPVSLLKDFKLDDEMSYVDIAPGGVIGYFSDTDSSSLKKCYRLDSGKTELEFIHGELSENESYYYDVDEFGNKIAEITEEGFYSFEITYFGEELFDFELTEIKDDSSETLLTEDEIKDIFVNANDLYFKWYHGLTLERDADDTISYNNMQYCRVISDQFSSVDEIKNAFSNYFMSELYEDAIDNYYFMDNGKLYVRAVIGDGGDYFPTKFKLTVNDNTAEHCDFVIESYYDDAVAQDNPPESMPFLITNVNGNWIFNSDFSGIMALYDGVNPNIEWIS